MPTAGELLKQNREERGISLADVSKATKISPRYLEAIEENRPDLLPSPLYQKVFLRAYARELGFSTDEIESQLEQMGLDETSYLALPSQKRGKYFDLAFALGAVALSLTVFILLWQNSNEVSQAQPDTVLKAMQKLPLAVSGQDTDLLAAGKIPLELKLEAVGISNALIVSGNDTLFQGVLSSGQTSSWKSWQGFVVALEHPEKVKLYANGRHLAALQDRQQAIIDLRLTSDSYKNWLKKETKARVGG